MSVYLTGLEFPEICSYCRMLREKNLTVKCRFKTKVCQEVL